jgi:TatD DNase family protein
MSPRFIDTHAHLDADIYERDLDVIVRHALDNDVWIVTLGKDYESSLRAVEIAERYPRGVFAAIGLHPKHVDELATADEKLVDLQKYRELAQHPKVVAIGETGLDFHDLPDDPRIAASREHSARIKDNQKKAFLTFLELSREFRLPLLLHCREAHEEMIDMLTTWNAGTPGFDARGIVHCFSGTWKDARRYYALDFSVSYTGTMAHGAYQLDVLKKSPESRITVESDCPHATAVAWGARRSEPSYLPHAVDAIAATRGITAEAMAAAITENALRIMKRIPRS